MTHLARVLVAGVAALAACAAHAQVQVDLVALGAAEVRWGSGDLALRAEVTGPCAALAGATLSLETQESRLLASAPVPASPCPPSGNATASVPFVSLELLALEPGPHYLRARVSGATPAQSPLLLVRLTPEFSLAGAVRPVNAGISTDASFSTCQQRDARLYDRETAPVPMPPPNLRTPYDLVTFESSLCAAPPPSLPAHSQLALIELPEVIAPGSEIWIHDQALGAAPRWRKACVASSGPCTGPAAFIAGRSAVFEIRGGAGPLVIATAAIAIPQPVSRDLFLQDLWWGGSEEAGWGINVAKNDERIFATLFAYDGAGRPQWYVMPQGQWDPVHEVYYGDLYRPTGAPYNAYDAARFKMGEAVGTGSLSFVGTGDGHFDYTIDGASGGKSISRFEYAPRGPEPSPLPGMWWGGAGQDGWGVSIQLQGDVMFATWYTYGADGSVTWLYMPAGRRTSPTTYAGTLYRTTGAAWVGMHYRGTSTHASEAGTMELAFTTPDTATMTARVDGASSSRRLIRFGF